MGHSKEDFIDIAIVQITATSDPTANIAKINHLIKSDPAAGRADLVIIPEYGVCCGNDITLTSNALTSDKWAFMFTNSRGYEPTGSLLIGGAPVRRYGKIFNTAILVNPDGRVVTEYDKIHLFEYTGGQHNTSPISESDIFSPGHKIVTINIKGWAIRVSICFDLRFPELYRAGDNIDIAICTAAFTQETGQAHWLTLLGARAIENQCYVAAAGLAGINIETGVNYFGNSCFIDPWGIIISNSGTDDDCILVHRLESKQINDVRNRLPAVTRSFNFSV